MPTAIPHLRTSGIQKRSRASSRGCVPSLKTWFRSEVRGLDLMPPGGTLLVSNHSGGLYAVDVPVSPSTSRQVRLRQAGLHPSNDIMFRGPRRRGLLTRVGFIPASRANAAAALRSGGIVVVFPGGDFDAYRPTSSANRFISPAARVRPNGIETGVPIVPMVS